MTYDLSKKIVNPAGQDVMYQRNKKVEQHDVLSLITEALWAAPGNDLKLAVKMGVCADRLQRAEDKTQVEITDDDLSLIRQALETVKYPAMYAVPISIAVPKLIEG